MSECKRCGRDRASVCDSCDGAPPPGFFGRMASRLLTERDALRAEVERLKQGTATYSFDRLDECPACRAKPGSPTLCKECVERRALRARVAELERERDNWQEMHHVAVRERDDARAEVERLRGRIGRVLARLGDDSDRAEDYSPVDDLEAALAGSPVETRVCPHGMAEDECRRAYGTPCPGAPVGTGRVREVLDLTGEPTPEVLDRLSEVQSYVRCGEPSARDRALAERVRLHVAEQFFLVMERGDVSLSDAFDKMRALDLDALLEER